MLRGKGCKYMLQDFNLWINTRFIFGREVYQNVGGELQKQGAGAVLLHHDNGPYLYDNGLLDDIKAQLERNGIRWVELGGVLPNPRLTLVREGIALVRKEELSYVLAIGGGSVIDSAKAIALGAVNEGDAWDFSERDARWKRHCL